MSNALSPDAALSDPATMIRYLAVSADVAKDRHDSETAMRLIDLIYSLCDAEIDQAPELAFIHGH